MSLTLIHVSHTHTCAFDMTHVWHDSFIVQQAFTLIEFHGVMSHMSHVQRAFIRHDSFMRGTWLSDCSRSAHIDWISMSHVTHESCHTWVMSHMSHVKRASIWHDSFIVREALTLMVTIIYLRHYVVALVSRIDTIIGLFCKRGLQKRLYFAKETYDLIDPANRSHPI